MTVCRLYKTAKSADRSRSGWSLSTTSTLINHAVTSVAIPAATRTAFPGEMFPRTFPSAMKYRDVSRIHVAIMQIPWNRNNDSSDRRRIFIRRVSFCSFFPPVFLFLSLFLSASRFFFFIASPSCDELPAAARHESRIFPTWVTSRCEQWLKPAGL